jgi:hypothetical protein
MRSLKVIALALGLLATAKLGWYAYTEFQSPSRKISRSDYGKCSVDSECGYISFECGLLAVNRDRASEAIIFLKEGEVPCAIVESCEPPQCQGGACVKTQCREMNI